MELGQLEDEVCSELRLNVPRRRFEECQWICRLDPTTVANILQLCEKIFVTGSMNRPDADAREILEARIKHMENQQSMLTSEITSSTVRHQQQISDELCSQRDMFKTQFAQSQGMYQQQLEDCQSACKKQMQVMEDRLASVAESHREDQSRAESRHDSAKDSLLRQISKLEAELGVEMENKRKIEQEYASRLEPLVKDTNDALRSLTRNARTGELGEKIVSTVFERLNVGYLEDVRRCKDTGCEDYVWTRPDEGMRCSVEVKYVERIHSQHDMAKHQMRIQEGIRAGKINCALFLSLRCPVPNMRDVELKNVHGTPVRYISGGNEIAPCTVAQSGFKMMAACFSHLKTAATENGGGAVTEAIYAQISTLLQKQLDSMNTMTVEITNMTKHVSLLQRSIEKLDKLRATVSYDISTIQITHPEIQQVDITGTGSTGIESWLLPVLEYRDKHCRYPKSSDQLVPSPPVSIDFTQLIALAKKKRRETTREEDSTI